MEEKRENKRIAEIIDVIVKVASGDYSVQVPLSDENNEIDALAIGLNMMIDDIRNNFEIKTQYLKIEQINADLIIARNKAEESESSLRNAQEIAKMGSWEWDMVTQKTRWSDNYFAILGFKPEEVEPNFELFRSRIHQDDVHLLDETHKTINKDKTPASFELRLIQPDGTFIWIQNNISPVIEEKKLVKLKGVIIDITDRKREEEVLFESRQLFKTLLNSIPVRVFWKDKDLNYLGCNTLNARDAGFENPEDIIGKDDYSMNWREQAELYRADDRLVIESGRPKLLIEELQTTPSGERINLLTSKVPLKNAAGEIIGILGTYIDITERKQVEEALQESEAIYGNLVLKMPDGVYKSTHDGKFVDVNPAMVKMLGYDSKEDILSIDIKTQLYFEPADRENLVLQEESEEIGVFRLKKKDGSVIWVEDHGWYNRDKNGVIISHEEIMRDITQRKLAEVELVNQKKFFEQMFAQSSVSTQILDKDGWCERINLKLSQIFGVQPEHIQGRVYNIFKDEAIKQGGVIPLLEKVFKEGKTAEWEVYFNIGLAAESQNIEVEEKRKVWYHNWAYPIFDENDKLSHVIIQHNDITDRKQVEDEIKLKNEELQKLNAEKDKFFSIIAHDLRGPLGSFMGLTEVMASDSQDFTPDQKKDLTLIMSHSVRNIFNLLENLLEWSQIQRGNIAFNPHIFDLTEVVTECLKTVVESARNKAIELTVVIPGELKVIADTNMLQTVIRNLVSNAIKFTPKGGKVIISAGTGENNRMIFSVKDTGIGISDKILNNLFRIDAKTGRPGTEGELSTGLGLLLCKEFIEKHNGRIWVESEERKGSVFYFTLPFKAK